MDFKKIVDDIKEDIVDDLNLNTVSAEALSKVPGIGPERAQTIVENRPFHDWLDLKSRVPGISDGLIKTLQDHGAKVA